MMPNRKKTIVSSPPSTGASYWREHFTDRPYYTEEANFDTYVPAYEYGELARSRYEGKSFAEVEADIQAEWEKLARSKGRQETILDWETARPAIQDAYERTLQLQTEELNVEKEQVRTGEVKVRKEVKTKVKTIDVPVEHEEIVIERHPVRGKTGTQIGKSEEIRIPVREEKVRVTKTPVVKEEVSVRKRKVKDQKHIVETVKDEEAVLDEQGITPVVNDAGVRRRKK
jgi:uncharacterized protein (TIGR02271 family)